MLYAQNGMRTMPHAHSIAHEEELPCTFFFGYCQLFDTNIFIAEDFMQVTHECMQTLKQGFAWIIKYLSHLHNLKALPNQWVARETAILQSLWSNMYALQNIFNATIFMICFYTNHIIKQLSKAIIWTVYYIINL